jgi:hypothetical protein
VPRHLVGDWEAFLTLMGMREWIENIQVRVLRVLGSILWIDVNPFI